MLHIFDKEGKWQQQGSHWIPSFLWQKEQMYEDFDVECRKSKLCCHKPCFTPVVVTMMTTMSQLKLNCLWEQPTNVKGKEGWIQSSLASTQILFPWSGHYFVQHRIGSKDDRPSLLFLRMIERKRRKTVERKWKDRTLFSFVDPDPGQVILDVSRKQMKKREEERELRRKEKDSKFKGRTEFKLSLSLSLSHPLEKFLLDLSMSLISVCLLFSLLNQLHCQQQQPKNKEGASVQRKPLQDPDTSSHVPSLLFFDLLIQHKLTIVFPSQLFLRDLQASCIDCWTSCHISVSVYMFTSFDISMHGI